MRNQRKTANLKYISLRSALLARGHTISSFARIHGINKQTAYCAAKGMRNGVKSAAFRRKLEDFVRE
jgi:hypothetical protein